VKSTKRTATCLTTVVNSLFDIQLCVGDLQRLGQQGMSCAGRHKVKSQGLMVTCDAKTRRASATAVVYILSVSVDRAPFKWHAAPAIDIHWLRTGWTLSRLGSMLNRKHCCHQKVGDSWSSDCCYTCSNIRYHTIQRNIVGQHAPKNWSTKNARNQFNLYSTCT